MPAPWRKCSRTTARDQRNQAAAAVKSSQRTLAATQELTAEVEHLGHWLARLRSANHFSERIAQLVQDKTEERSHGDR